jgi:class 3 adenylate cyclase/tetratricopeptide (TPR) repeat protein
MPACASCGRENPDEARFCMACAAPLAPAQAPRELRKTVTALFCDVVGSTELAGARDPEAVRAVLARYFDRMKAIVESHGGTVEKFIGDAVMAVFGVPVVHEDDALRACRAAVEMREALPELGIDCRIGINTGEVVTANDGVLASGDAINVAARLEQAAQPGEVLLGEPTLALVRSAIEMEPVVPLELKGKADPVPAFRLIAVTGELQRRFATPMVGRDRELRSLQDALARAVHDRSCQLFTILGAAGVGKSRLASELLGMIEARVVRGRCLSYGDGITYWPVVEVLKQLGTLPADDGAAIALRSLLGEATMAASSEEIAWGFRKLLEQEAQAAPLVCMFDDLHWAEPTFLALVESMAELSRDAPILLLCMARLELLELRPSWGGGMWNATTVLLEPLDASETEQLLAKLGGADAELALRIAAAAEGNPLFLEEMLELVRASPDGRVEVPPTIQALLAARLDQLDAAERAVLERGSVEGQIFHRGAVEALGDGEPERERLTALVRKQLVRPDRPQLPSEDAYRFRHLLIRDAAYDALPKSMRADLHRRFAGWLETHGRDLVELDEILGYHLEQAAQCLADLGRPDAGLAADAAARLADAGRRSRWRGDRRAARSLLERAVALSDELDVHLMVDLVRSYDGPEGMAPLMDDVAERAAAAGDEAGAALARASAAYARVFTYECSPAEQEKTALAAIRVLEAAGDHAGLAEVWATLANGVYGGSGTLGQMEHASEETLRHAHLAGRQPSNPWTLSIALTYGSKPPAIGLERLAAVAVESPRPQIDLARAMLLAMSGHADEARSLAAAAEARLLDLGEEPGQGIDFWIGEMERVLGDNEVALLRMQSNYDYLVAHGGIPTYAAGTVARLLCFLGRHDEAEPFAEQARDLLIEADDTDQAIWRGAMALVRARRAVYAEAEQLAGEAVAYARKTDSPLFEGDALCDLAEVLELAGRLDDAAEALGEAVKCYERKEAVPCIDRTRARLAALQPAEA